MNTATPPGTTARATGAPRSRRLWTRALAGPHRRSAPPERRTALGFLRTDIAGIGQVRDESALRDAAAGQGYDLRESVAFDATTVDPVARLAALAAELGVDAVFGPSFAHFGDTVPARLIRVATVVIVDPLVIYPRFDPQVVD